MAAAGAAIPVEVRSPGVGTGEKNLSGMPAPVLAGESAADGTSRGRPAASGSAIVAVVAALTLALHLAASGVYGLFVDELYFLACGEHLAWGYVDMPPLTALQAWLARALFGDSMLAIRLFPALASAGLVLLAGALARALGGRRFAQGLAAVAVAVAPGYLLVGSLLSMNSVEPLVWTACVLVLIALVRSGDMRLWLAFGALAGIGLENKDTVLVFGFAVVAGLALTPERRLIANRWFLLGGVVALLIFLPNLIWIVEHHFPHLEQLANIRRNHRNVELSPLVFTAQQALFPGPFGAPLCLAGLWHFLGRRAGRPYRSVGFAYVILIGVLLAVGGRVYYPLPFYAVFLAAGAVALEEWTRRRALRWARGAYAGLVLAGGAILAPLAMPLLAPEAYLRYTRALHLSPPPIEHRKTSALPQLFADRFGWPEMAETVANVYHALSPEDQRRCAIFANDYGEAGAIDFYGPRLGLPKAISGHLTYWYWGPRGYTGECMIVLGDTRAGVERWFSDVRAAAVVSNAYSMRSQNFTVFVCRKPKGFATLQQAWPRLKNWN
jgi:Dolichyl-phosphate-mannose-protein mannosyltransferase